MEFEEKSVRVLHVQNRVCFIFSCFYFPAQVKSFVFLFIASGNGESRKYDKSITSICCHNEPGTYTQRTCIIMDPQVYLLWLIWTFTVVSM